MSVQDRCMVCAKGTIGYKLVWKDQTVLLGYEAQVDACFCPFGDSANLDRIGAWFAPNIP